MSPTAGGGGVAGSQLMRTAVHIKWHGAQIPKLWRSNSYLTYAVAVICHGYCRRSNPVDCVSVGKAASFLSKLHDVQLDCYIAVVHQLSPATPAFLQIYHSCDHCHSQWLYMPLLIQFLVFYFIKKDYFSIHFLWQDPYSNCWYGSTTFSIVSPFSLFLRVL